MSQLKDKNGDNCYPTTTTENVIAGENKTLEQRLQTIEQGGSGDVWEQSQLTTASADHYLDSISKGSRINPSAHASPSGNKYNVLVCDVVGCEKIKIDASANTGAYALFVFADKSGFAVDNSESAGYNGTAIITKEVTVPEGAVKLYISENEGANGAGSTKIYRKTVSGQAMAAYRESINTGMAITPAELQKYYDLGAQKMDTYNLVQEKVGIITIGQSNAAGRIPHSDFPSTASINGETIQLNKSIPTCKIIQGSISSTYNEGEKNFASFNGETIQTDNGSGLLAFDWVLYNAIANALGNSTDFYVCKQTRGNTSLQYQYATSFWPNIDAFKFNAGWVPQLYHLKLLVKRALELQPDIKFKAIIMHQGEADSVLSKTEGAYYVGLCHMIQWIRGLVGSPNLPFIFGSVPTNSAAFSEIIYNDMVRCAADMDNVYLVTMGVASGWLDDGLQQHFSAADAVKLADDMYKLMVSNKMLAPYI